MTPVKMEFVTVKAEPIILTDSNERSSSRSNASKMIEVERRATDTITVEPNIDYERNNKTRSNARKSIKSESRRTTAKVPDQDDESGKFKRKFICDICKKRCMAKFTIELHMKSKHNMATNLRQCPHCEKYFTSRKYPRHMDKHEKPYECAQCSKRFSSDTNLRRHISDIHEQLKQFLCSMCGKSFAQKSDLRIHISRMHLNDYYSCSTCGKSYKSKYIVQQHEITHLPEEEQEKLIACGKYKRPKQNRLTTNELTMQYYSKLMNTDQNFTDADKPIDPERPFRCNWCGKYFKSKAVRYLHMRIHMGDKRYKCDVCDRKFTQNNQLQTHKRTHTGEKPFKCEYCEKTFACKKSCVAHMRLHTGEKPYRCELCSECFIDLNGLKRHRKKVHPN